MYVNFTKSFEPNETLFSSPVFNTYLEEVSFLNSRSTSSPNSSTSSPALPKVKRSSKSKSPTSKDHPKERRVFDLPCAICGNVATGYHYNVASCNGCKTFFRRSVLSKTFFRCIRSDSNCFANFDTMSAASRTKCRSCRLDRCLQEGMRREAVTSTVYKTTKTSLELYLDSIALPTTSSAIQRVTEIASCLRQCFHLINKFRRCNIARTEIDLNIKTLLTSASLLEDINKYEDISKIPCFKRALPDWLTMDLACSIEFCRKMPDFHKFDDCDKEELARSSCFTIAVAIQAIDSYFLKHKRIIMPDGTDIIQSITPVGKEVDKTYWQMFVTILDPLYRDEFTIDELVMSLNLLFYRSADLEKLSDKGKEQLELSVQTAMQNLQILLISRNQDTFITKYGALVALNSTFMSYAILHKQKMTAAKFNTLDDFLIEQLVFDYREETLKP